MTYRLTYSFNAGAGLTLTPKYIDISGTIGAAVSSAGNFEHTGWYGFTLDVESDYRGFIGFFDPSGVLAAQFAVNPEEGENLDARVSNLDDVGPGGVRYPVTVKDTSGNPIQGAQVWLTTDPGGRDVVAGTLVTGSTGVVTFEVPPGIYYLWRQARGFTFPNPKIASVS